MLMHALNLLMITVSKLASIGENLWNVGYFGMLGINWGKEEVGMEVIYIYLWKVNFMWFL